MRERSSLESLMHREEMKSIGESLRSAAEQVAHMEGESRYADAAMLEKIQALRESYAKQGKQVPTELIGKLYTAAVMKELRALEQDPSFAKHNGKRFSAVMQELLQRGYRGDELTEALRSEIAARLAKADVLKLDTEFDDVLAALDEEGSTAEQPAPIKITVQSKQALKHVPASAKGREELQQTSGYFGSK